MRINKKTLAEVKAKYERLTQLLSRINPFDIIVLSRAYFEKPISLCAFVLRLLDEKNCVPADIIASHLMHQFFVYHMPIFESEETTEKSSNFHVFYQLLDRMKKIYPSVNEFLLKVEKTFCGIRGAKINFPSENSYCSINLMGKDFYHAAPLTVTDALYTAKNFPPFFFINTLKNANKLLREFGMDFFLNLDFQQANHVDCFHALRRHSKTEAMLKQFFEEAVLTHRMPESQFESVIRYAGLLYFSQKKEEWIALIDKNIAFFYLCLFQPTFFNAIGLKKTKSYLTQLTDNLINNYPVSSAAALLREAVLYFNDELSFDFIMTCAEKIFSYGLQLLANEDSVTEALLKLPKNHLPFLCANYFEMAKMELQQVVSTKKSYVALELAWANFLRQANIIRRMVGMMDNQLFLRFNALYNRIVYPSSKPELMAFFIKEASEQKIKISIGEWHHLAKKTIHLNEIPSMTLKKIFLLMQSAESSSRARFVGKKHSKLHLVLLSVKFIESCLREKERFSQSFYPLTMQWEAMQSRPLHRLIKDITVFLRNRHDECAQLSLRLLITQLKAGNIHLDALSECITSPSISLVTTEVSESEDESPPRRRQRREM